MTIPDVHGRPAHSRKGLDAYNWLYERAEEAYSTGLTLEDALEAVRCGYSSAEADEDFRRDP